MKRARARWSANVDPDDDPDDADDFQADDQADGPDLPGGERWARGVGHLSLEARGRSGRQLWRCECGREVTYAPATVELLATLPRGARCPACYLASPERRALEAARVERIREWQHRDATRPRPEPAPRCGAWARSAGRACVAKALANGRCKNHGGASTGPTTVEGRGRLSAAVVAWWARWRAATPVELPDQLADVETARAWLVEAGARASSPVRLAVAPDRPDVEAWRAAARAVGVLVRRRQVRRGGSL